MNRWLRIGLELLVVALAVWQLVDVGAAMSARLTADFDLEWMEGATLITALRASQGQPFYTVPTADYIPFIYPPVYAWLVGALSAVFPLGYTLGRAVSIVGCIGTTLMLASAARQEGARWPVAFGVGALFVGCYEEAGTFYDLVRIDMLAMITTSAALLLGRREGAVSAVSAGVLLAAGFATKHNMAAFGLPILLWRYSRFGWRDAARFAAASVGPALAFVVAMQVATGGLFLTYLLEVPAQHGMVWTRALPNLKAGRVEGAQAELVRALPVVTVVGLATAWWWVRTAAGRYWAGHLVLGLILVSVMRGHQGGFLNVLIPMFWLMPLLLPVAIAALQGETGWRRHVATVGTALLALQLWEGRGNLEKYLPTDADRRAAAALVQELATIEGPIAMPHAPWYPVMAGKDPSFALIALWDIDHERGPFYRASHAVDRAIANGRWSALVLPDDKLGHGLKAGYRKERPLKARGFRTRTGWGVRFGSVWVPIPESERGRRGPAPEAPAPEPEQDEGQEDGGGGADEP